MDFYNTIEKQGIAEYKDRGSRFIAYAYPLESKAVFKSIYQSVKTEHPKATHHCFAYRLGLDKTDFRTNDAGEPSGTAGRPILGQIDSRELTNILIIVVRYFGGTLLGVPGLINAYKTAASFVLQVTPAVQKKIELICQLQFDYTRMNEVMKILRQFNCTIISREAQLFCVIHAGIAKANLGQVKTHLLEIPNLELTEIAG